ncbi:MAG: C4-dicarboxylate ABC transporter permease [Acidobacteria bacterium]|nr:MAG: C4-dicarboxylate ABC transporter permease [Acidobacteriota bacterium]
MSTVGTYELLTFGVMVAVFCFSAFKLKLPIGLAMLVAAVTGAITGGAFLPLPDLLRHMAEGSFAYFDPILIISAATIFMFIIEENGLMKTLARWMIITFHRRPVLLLAAITVIIMFPGMLTGSSTAAVLTTGALMSPVLLHLGVPRAKTGAVIAMAALFGMAAPPVNIPALIIGAGVDLPYVGLDIPLLVMTVPLALCTTWALALKHCRNIDLEVIKKNLPTSSLPEHGPKLFLPLLVLAVLIVFERAFPHLSNMGLPLIFLIATLVATRTGHRVNFLKISQKAMAAAIPILAILVGVGIFIQVMTLTGARGEVVTQAVRLPRGWLGLYPVMACSLPLFGAVSSFGAASVLGVPFVLSLPTSSQVVIVNTAALSLIASLGDLMPPTALAGLFAAQVVGEKKYIRVLKWCLVPGVITAIVGILFIYWAGPIGNALVIF